MHLTRNETQITKGCLFLAHPVYSTRCDRTSLRPEYDDETVEDVESVADVAKQSVREDLHQHFDGEQCAEEQVAVFQHQRVRSRLQHEQ